MISRIRGILTEIESDHVLLEVNGITYAVLVSPFVADHLLTGGKTGTEIMLHTMYYIEGSAGMGNLIPRLVGFSSSGDLSFFKLLTSVQGLGVRKALRSLVIPVHDVALAVEMEDTVTLRKLPEIGPKTAKKIIVELKGKLAQFMPDSETPATATQMPFLTEEYQQDALDVLLQIQYSRDEAEYLLALVVKNHPELTRTEEIIQEVFRLQAK